MRTAITLDDDVFEAVKSQAQASGKSLGQVLSQLARRGLRSSAQGTQTNGQPVFKVTSDSGMIPGTRARDLLAEEAQ